MAVKKPAVLVVDDETDFRITICDFLEDYDYPVFQAGNGQEGLELYRQRQPDIILTDLQMPKMDGLSLIEHIASDNPLLPIIVISGANDISNALKAINAGAWDYLVKPIVDMNILLHILDRVIERAGHLRREENFRNELAEEVEQKTAELRLANLALQDEIRIRRKAEEDQRRNRVLLRTVIDSVPYLIFVASGNGRILLANKTLSAYLNHPLSELENIDGTMVANDESFTSTVLQSIHVALNTNRSHFIPERTFASPLWEQPRTFQTTYIPIQMPGYEEMMVLVVSKDITEEKKQAEKQRQATEVLQKAARIASIGVIAGGVTHEINQPLNGLLLNSETLQMIIQNNDNIPKQQVFETVSDIRSAAGRISDIIKHMRLMWVEPSTGDLVPVAIGKAIQGAIEFLGQQIQNHLVNLHVQLPVQPVYILANPVQFEQIVLNLLTNALRALDISPNPGKWIRVTAWTEDETLFLQVDDNGPGLGDTPPDQLFDPFYSSRKSEEGTGLGLAIVKTYVEHFKGSITVKNLDNSGARFQLQFPTCKQEREKP